MLSHTNFYWCHSEATRIRDSTVPTERNLVVSLGDTVRQSGGLSVSHRKDIDSGDVFSSTFVAARREVNERLLRDETWTRRKSFEKSHLRR